MSVIVYGDPDKPALITYPNLALNCKCSQFIFFYLLSLVSRLYLYFTFCSRICLSSFLGYIMIALYMYIWKYDSIFYLCIGADISCFQGLFYVQKQLLYCFTTFAYIISVLLDMRFVSWLIWMCFLLHLELNIIIHIVFPLELPQEFLQLGAAAICVKDPVPSAEDLADQIIEVLNYFG